MPVLRSRSMSARDHFAILKASCYAVCRMRSPQSVLALVNVVLQTFSIIGGYGFYILHRCTACSFISIAAQMIQAAH